MLDRILAVGKHAKTLLTHELRVPFSLFMLFMLLFTSGGLPTTAVAKFSLVWVGSIRYLDVFGLFQDGLLWWYIINHHDTILADHAQLLEFNSFNTQILGKWKVLPCLVRSPASPGITWFHLVALAVGGSGAGLVTRFDVTAGRTKSSS